ncbi:kynureninase [Rhodocaloribacter litoris]|nr:kynureninase [Rhodocaloribacter litoris]QXD15706.1 kynureninase [Rhodocaloribacter litoris]
MMDFEPTLDFARRMDADDPLAAYRDHFHIPKTADGAECLYFTGNSLGLQPKATREYVLEELEDWARLGVEGHFHARHPWMPYHEFLTGQTARLVGARPVEVVVMNSLTVNLHLMMVSFYRPTPDRHRIVLEAHAFPSDRYAAASQIRFHGYDPSEALVELAPRPGEDTLRTEDIEAFLEREGESVALVLLGGVNYYTGQAFDLERITRAAHAQGCVVGFDLAHAAGNLALRLHDDGPDFAVWCSYKYLNAGPGSLAGCFVHERHARAFDLPRFAGWWGHDKATRFQMPETFTPMPGAEGWQLSNPPILPLAALRASMDLFDAVGMTRLREKSVRLTGYLAYLLERRVPDRVRIITPADPAQRGAQLSLRVAGGRDAFERLTAAGVVCDWREPDALRVAPVPFYNTFTDVYRFVEMLRNV